MAEAIKMLLLFLSALFPMVNPLGGSPAFLSLTKGYSQETRRALSRWIAMRDSKTFFLLKKMRQYSLEIPPDHEIFRVEDFVKYIEDSLRIVMKSPDCYAIPSEIKHKEWNKKKTFYGEKFLKELNIGDLVVLPNYLDYLDKIYKKEKLFQKDLFKRVVAITRLFYSYLIVLQLLKLREKIKKNSNDSSIWIDAYKIGSLQGNLSLIESLSDSDLIDIHFKGKSGERSQKLWNEVKKQEEKMEGPLVDEIRSKAVDIWDIKKKIVLHDEVAQDISNKLIEAHPDIADKRWLIQLVFRTVRPMAKERGFLRGVRRPDFSGTVVEVDVKASLIAVKNNVEEKTFFVSKAGGRKMQLADLKGMNVSVTYRVENGRMVARAIRITTPERLPQKKVKKKPAKGSKK